MESANPRSSLLFFTLVCLLSFSDVRPSPEDRRYTRGTTFQGISTGIHRDTKLEAGEDLHINTVSTASITTSTQPQPLPVAQVLSIHVPPEAFHVHDAGVSSSFSSSESVVGHTSSVLVSKPPTLFIRPEGGLPLPPDRFGFDIPNGLHPGAIPNCGCVSLGACLGKVGDYTRLVLPYTDVVCGHRFQTCCFDGPWAGDYDSFAIAAACVAKEECARPYGVLPTDVRDFGVIAPCPGHGAVRCLAVSSEELLIFQATVAAIDAANAHHHAHEPIHFMIPVVTGVAEGATTIEATATSSLSAFSEDDPPAVIAPPATIIPPPTTVIPPPTTVIPPPTTVIPPPTTMVAPPTTVIAPPITVIAPPSTMIAPPTTVIAPPTTMIAPPAVVIPPAAVPGYYSPYYGGGLPWGYGAGLGIRKRISINKGFSKGIWG